MTVKHKKLRISSFGNWVSESDRRSSVQEMLAHLKILQKQMSDLWATFKEQTRSKEQEFVYLIYLTVDALVSIMLYLLNSV